MKNISDIGFSLLAYAAGALLSMALFYLIGAFNTGVGKILLHAAIMSVNLGEIIAYVLNKPMIFLYGGQSNSLLKSDPGRIFWMTLHSLIAFFLLSSIK